ncbi:hypothetical protein TNCV_2982821 [Trichonephila clavipes]|nr:hypothetical protein TNCV_2982821 [Trichonephila clavipes]
MHVKYIEAHMSSRWCGLEVKREREREEEGGVSSSSLDCGSKLREVDSDDDQELLDSLNQELTSDDLTERHKPEQNIEELSSIRRSNKGLGNRQKISF